MMIPSEWAFGAIETIQERITKHNTDSLAVLINLAGNVESRFLLSKVVESVEENGKYVIGVIHSQ